MHQYNKTCIYLLLITTLGMSPLLAESTENKWFGQPLPGNEPIRFAAQILYNTDTEIQFTEIHGAPQFSPDGTLMLLEYQTYNKEAKTYKNSILMATLGKDGWSNLKPVPFSGNFNNSTPSFHPDGKRLFFVSNRNSESDSEKDDKDIWYVKYEDQLWG